MLRFSNSNEIIISIALIIYKQTFYCKALGPQSARVESFNYSYNSQRKKVSYVSADWECCAIRSDQTEGMSAFVKNQLVRNHDRWRTSYTVDHDTTCCSDHVLLFTTVKKRKRKVASFVCFYRKKNICCNNMTWMCACQIIMKPWNNQVN